MARRPRLKKITGKQIRESAEWLIETQAGCSHYEIANTRNNVLAFVIGFLPLGECKDGKPKYGVFAKIGFQSHKNIMQCDFGVDWDMPYNPETGDVFDTIISVCDEDGPVPSPSRGAEIARSLNSVRIDAYDLLIELEEKS